MLLPLLRTVERDGLRCATLTLLVGFVLGAGLIEMLVLRFSLSGALALRILVLALLDLIGPLLVALIVITRLTPVWLARGRELPHGGARSLPLAAAPVGALLQLDLLFGALVGAVALSRAGGGAGALPGVFAVIAPAALLSALLRAALYATGACLLCAAEARRPAQPPALAERRLGGLILRQIALVLGLKLLWILAFDPAPLPPL